MKKIIRIGTRDSQLALWQAKFVEKLLNRQGLMTELVPVKSEGDLDLVSPLYEMGVQGIFTKTLDVALLLNKIDIAVHSFKDVPVQLPKDLIIASVPERGNRKDSLVFKDPDFDPEKREHAVIATSSLRRKAQWLNRYPGHIVVPIRGNNNTRLEKLNNHPDWDGALFASAGIERIGLPVPCRTEPDWMLPAPAQGALAVICRSEDTDTQKVCSVFNHQETAYCTFIEREFLRTLMGGCSMPIAALAEVKGDRVVFKGNIFSVDGVRKAEISLEFPLENLKDAGKKAAFELLAHGGESIVRELKGIIKS